MKGVYITIVIVLTVTIATLILFTIGGRNVQVVIKTEDKMSEIQLSEDIYIQNCIYDYRIKSFRIFVFSPPVFPNSSCVLDYDTTKVNCSYYYKPYRIFTSPYGHLIIPNIYTRFPKYIIINETRIPVNIPYQGDEPIYNLDLCICKLVNYTAVNRLIQTIEAYRLFGVDHFTLYLTSASETVLKVISYYQSLNIMELVISNKSFIFSKYMIDQMYGQLAKGDDCIYRNMKRSKGVIVADLDEILWPVKHKTITDLIDYYKKYNYFTLRSFQFHTEVVNGYDRWTHNIPDTDIFIYREYCRYKQGWVQKNIYTKLDAIYSIFIHWILDGTNELKRIYVPHEIMYIRHTRRLRSLKEVSCESNWTTMAVDPREKIINKFAKKIRKILQINPPSIIQPPILKDISPLKRLLYKLIY